MPFVLAFQLHFSFFAELCIFLTFSGTQKQTIDVGDKTIFRMG
jgi:hypothetical protein